MKRIWAGETAGSGAGLLLGRDGSHRPRALSAKDCRTEGSRFDHGMHGVFREVDATLPGGDQGKCFSAGAHKGNPV